MPIPYPTPPRDTSARVGRARAVQVNPDAQAQDKAIEQEILRQSNGRIPQPNMPLERAPGVIYANTRDANELVREMLARQQAEEEAEQPTTLLGKALQMLGAK